MTHRFDCPPTAPATWPARFIFYGFLLFSLRSSCPSNHVWIVAASSSPSANSNYNNRRRPNDAYDSGHENQVVDGDFDYRRLEPRVPAPQLPPPPPPPPPGQSSTKKQQQPPPRHPLQQQPTFGETSNDSKYTPIDYAFPSKTLVNQKQQQKQQQKRSDNNNEKKKGRSFFGFGRGKPDEEPTDELGAVPTTATPADDGDELRNTAEGGDNQPNEDWFDISGAKPTSPSNPKQSDSDTDPDRPWVDADLRPAQQEYASARRDPVARYMAQSTVHRFTVYFWATSVGAGLGAYLGQSLLGGTAALSLALFLASVFGLLAVWARNPYGDWTRAAGLACWWTLVKSKRLRRDYPTGRHFRALLGVGQRRRFPPGTDNPWQYKAAFDDDPDFEMWSALACMVLVGSLAGGTVPIVPSWMGALGGAGALAVLTTRKDARGDLCRTAGMRVRKLLGLGWSTVVDDLELPRLTGTVTRKVLDKILILDRQHKLQDKLMAGMAWGFNLVQNTVSQARGERVEEPRENRRRRGREDDDDIEPPRVSRRDGPPPRGDGPPPRGDGPPPRGDGRRRREDDGGGWADRDRRPRDRNDDDPRRRGRGQEDWQRPPRLDGDNDDRRYNDRDRDRRRP